MDKPEKTVSTQPAEGTVGMRPMATKDQVGEVPHFADGVGKRPRDGGKFAGDGGSHWSGK